MFWGVHLCIVVGAELATGHLRAAVHRDSQIALAVFKGFIPRGSCPICNPVNSQVGSHVPLPYPGTHWPWPKACWNVCIGYRGCRWVSDRPVLGAARCPPTSSPPRQEPGAGCESPDFLPGGQGWALKSSSSCNRLEYAELWRLVLINALNKVTARAREIINSESSTRQIQLFSVGELSVNSLQFSPFIHYLELFPK